MSQQQTLQEPVSYSGIGLHSGSRVNMTFHPAPPGSGIRFRRVDLDGKPEIEARVEHVVDTNRSTTLGKGNVKIHTVEHVLAAFSGAGVDNAIVDLDASEPPIADGGRARADEAQRQRQRAGGRAADVPTQAPHLPADRLGLAFVEEALRLRGHLRRNPNPSPRPPCSAKGEGEEELHQLRWNFGKHAR